MLNGKFIVFSAVVLGIFALSAVPAIAQEIDNATATVTCTNYAYLVFIEHGPVPGSSVSAATRLPGTVDKYRQFQWHTDQRWKHDLV
jgi:hypothetical protein